MQAKDVIQLTMFVNKGRIETDAAHSGAFLLTLPLSVPLGKIGRQHYRVTWEGPEAQAFWQRHGSALTPGTPLRADLGQLRTHISNTRPPHAELQARAKSIQILPRYAPSEREQLSKQEHSAAEATT